VTALRAMHLASYRWQSTSEHLILPSGVDARSLEEFKSKLLGKKWHLLLCEIQLNPANAENLLLCNQHWVGSAAQAGKGPLAHTRLICGREWMLSPRKDRQ